MSYQPPRPGRHLPFRRTAIGDYTESLCKRTGEEVFAVDTNGVYECKIWMARMNSRGMVVAYTLIDYKGSLPGGPPVRVPRKMVFKDRAEAEKAHFILKLKKGV